MTVLKITIAALILSFSMSTAVTAQDSLWTRTYGGEWWDGGRDQLAACRREPTSRC